MDISGGNVQQITNNTVLDSGPKWSPDCSTIAYNSLDTTSLDVHRVDADGGDDVNLTNAPGVFDAFAAWSPDGQQIVFSTNRDVNFEIYTMSSADGSGLTRITTTGLGEADLRSDWGTQPVLSGWLPPDTDACKNSGWQSFTAPQTFKNEGACVAFVESSASGNS